MVSALAWHAPIIGATLLVTVGCWIISYIYFKKGDMQKSYDYKIAPFGWLFFYSMIWIVALLIKVI